MKNPWSGSEVPTKTAPAHCLFFGVPSGCRGHSEADPVSEENDDRLSIARSIWRDAQEREKVYWAQRCSEPIGVMYEVGEDLDLAWRVKECVATEPKSFLDIGVDPMGTGLLWLFTKCSLKIGLDSLELLNVATGNDYADQLVRAMGTNRVHR